MFWGSKSSSSAQSPAARLLRAAQIGDLEAIKSYIAEGNPLDVRGEVVSFVNNRCIAVTTSEFRTGHRCFIVPAAGEILQSPISFWGMALTKRPATSWWVQS